jgi:TonB family protein
MRKTPLYPFFAAAIVLLVTRGLPAQETLIQIRAFQATWTAERQSKPGIEILSARSDLRLSSLIDKINGTESDLRATTIQALTKIYDLATIENLFSFILFWDGQNAIPGDFVIQPPASFRLEAVPSWRYPGVMTFRLVLWAKELPLWPPAGSKEEKAALKELYASVHPDFFKERMDKIFEAEVPLHIENPTVVSFPLRDKAMFLFLLPTERPQPVVQILPPYPEDLIRQGVTGQARFRISINEKGAVRNVTVKTSVHPYLDDGALRAIKQWSFEPVIKNQKAVPVSFDWTIEFNPAKWPNVAENPDPRTFEPPSAELKKILELGAAYCRRLSNAAMDYVCVETIKTTDYAMYLPKKAASEDTKTATKATDSGTLISIADRRSILSRDPYNTKTNRYVCDYQMIKKGDRIEERRILLKENGKPVQGKAKYLAEKRYAILQPLFAPIVVLMEDRQKLYHFRLIGEEKILGRAAAVVEAVALLGAPGGVPRAKIWVARDSFQILQCETFGMPVGGYEFVFQEASSIGISPIGITTTTFDVEKNGLLFPSRVSFLIEYPVNVWGIGKRTKVETDIRFDHYKFFTVETDNRIIRS